MECTLYKITIVKGLQTCEVLAFKVNIVDAAIARLKDSLLTTSKGMKVDYRLIKEPISG